MTKHTPTPWVVTGKLFDEVIIETTVDMDKQGHEYGDKTVIGSSEWTYVKDEDAKHIVKCINMHDELIYALEFIAKSKDCDAHKYFSNSLLLQMAIKKASDTLERVKKKK